MRHLIVAAALSLSCSAIAETWTVDDDGPADFDNIQAAINATSNGDTIEIATGTYFERGINTNGKSILISGALDAKGSPTSVIDGQGQLGTVLICNSGENTETIIENLMVINAIGIDGAGMACIESSPAIRHCVFRNGFGGYGGGLYCDAASPFLLNCVFEENHSNFAGGIYCNQSSPTLEGCTISGNSAWEDGGGIYCGFSSNPTLIDCVISGNMIEYNCVSCVSEDYCGGGIYCSGSSPTIIGCTIEGNTAYSGGGIGCWKNSNPTISGCTIRGNRGSRVGGGIICFYSSNPTLNNCEISNNESNFAGGIYCAESSPTLTNCAISANFAYGTGGGCYANYSSVLTLLNCTILNNSTLPAFGYYGGGIYSGNSSSSILAGCTISGNTASERGGGLLWRFQ